MTIEQFEELKSGTIIEVNRRFDTYIGIRCLCKWGFIVLDTNRRDQLGRHIRLYHHGEPHTIPHSPLSGLRYDAELITYFCGYNVDPKNIHVLDKAVYEISTDICEHEWRKSQV